MAVANNPLGVMTYAPHAAGGGGGLGIAAALPPFYAHFMGALPPQALAYFAGRNGFGANSGFGGGNSLADRMAPHVPNKPFSAFGPFMAQMLGGPLAWAGLGPFGGGNGGLGGYGGAPGLGFGHGVAGTMANGQDY